MANNRPDIQPNSARGAAYIELILVLPILILIVLGCLEFSNAIRTQQALAMISREAGNKIFRRCSEINEASALQDCVRLGYSEVYNSSTTALTLRTQDTAQRLDLIVGVYKYDNDCTGNSCPTLDAVFPGTSINRPEIQASSRFSRSHFFDSGARYNQLLGDNRVVVTGEVFLAYTPIIPFVGNLFFARGPGGRLLYEVALF